MRTCSYVMVGTTTVEVSAFNATCHDAGQRMGRHQATKRWHGRQVIDGLAERGIPVCGPSRPGVAKEVPGTCKEVDAVVRANEQAGLSRRVAPCRATGAYRVHQGVTTIFI